MEFKQLPEATATDIEERLKKLKERVALLQVLKSKGLNIGDEIRSNDLGVTVKIIQVRTSKLDTDLLMAYRVSGEIIEMSTIIKTSKDHIRFIHNQNQKDLQKDLQSTNKPDNEAGLM